MEVEIVRDGYRYGATWRLQGGLLIVTSPLGARTTPAEQEPEANATRATELLGEIVDDALSPRRRQ